MDKKVLIQITLLIIIVLILAKIFTFYQSKKGKNLVLIPITEVVKKFGRNHRTIQRRIHALKDEGLLDPVIKRNTISLYHIHNFTE